LAGYLSAFDISTQYRITVGFRTTTAVGFLPNQEPNSFRLHPNNLPDIESSMNFKLHLGNINNHYFWLLKINRFFRAVPHFAF